MRGGIDQQKTLTHCGHFFSVWPKSFFFVGFCFCLFLSSNFCLANSNQVWVIMTTLNLEGHHYVPGYYGGNFRSKAECNDLLNRMFAKLPHDAVLKDELWTVYTKTSGYGAGSYSCMKLPDILVELQVND